MQIDVTNQQGVPIELHPVTSAGVTVRQTEAVPVEVRKKQIAVEPQQQPNIGIDIVNKVAFGSGVIIVDSEQQYTQMWMDGQLDAKKWYVLYNSSNELQKVWLGKKLFARKGEEHETKTNVFPLVFPIVF